MGTTVEDRNAILATMGISEDDPGRTEILNNMGVAEDEDELRWFYQNQPEILEQLGLLDEEYYEVFDEDIEKEEESPSIYTYLIITFWVILFVAAYLL